MGVKQILVFDSGVGGLSVWDEIRLLRPDLGAIYLMDNARFPYGELAEQALIDGACALICQQVAEAAVDVVVVACNTASTLILPPLRAALNIPVVGVVPAIKPAALLAEHGDIGLLATPGTVARPYTRDLIQQFASHCRVRLLGSSKLVALAEAKLAGEPIDMGELQQVLEPWLAAPPEVVVLGCTHFPLLRDELQELLGEQAQLIDSGAAIARRLDQLLQPPTGGDSPAGQLCVTQINERLTRQQSAFAVRGFGQPQLVAVC